MKIRSLCLVFIFCVSLFPQNPVQAQAEPTITVFDSLALMYISDAILAGHTELEEASQSSILMAPVVDSLLDNPENAALAAALQATKELRNDLDTNCALLTSQYRAEGKDCEADLIQATCSKKKAELNSEIGLLHKIRGDRRRPLTKAWHSLKRSGRSLWHEIGPVGRNFLRQVGPEALKIVASGGTLNTSVLKTLFKHTAKNIVRDRIKDLAFQGVQSLVYGQVVLVKASGVDICDPEIGTTEENDNKAQEDISQGILLKYTLTTEEIDFKWQNLLEPEDESHSCGSLWPSEDEQFKPIEFLASIDMQNKIITAELQGSRYIENLSDGTSGYVVSRQNQSFAVKLDGPYQIDEITEGIVLAFRGNAKLTLTLDGERECQYWTIPSSGDPILNSYWINRLETINIDRPYELRVHSYDGQTGGLRLTIGDGENFEWNSGFYIRSEEVELSRDDIQVFFSNN